MKRANRDRITAVATLAAVGCAGTLLSGGTPHEKNADAPRHLLQQDEKVLDNIGSSNNDGEVLDNIGSSNNDDEERELKGEYKLIANIQNYPDLSEAYTNNAVEPRGTVEFVFHGKSFMARADLSGLEAYCFDCGIHIHEGTSCDSHDAVGDHYWRHDDPAVETHGDPWQLESGVRRAVYMTDGVGKTPPGHRFSLYSGYGFEMNEGHAVVVHARDGTRIGCGVLRHVNEFEKKDSSNPNEDDEKEPAIVNNTPLSAATEATTPSEQR
jgi:Cu/Zn superoxide dismutase